MRFNYPSKVLLAALVMLGCAFAYGGDIYVVTRPDVKLSSHDIREIYLGDKEFSGDVRLVPVDNQAAQAEFVVKALAMNPQRYNTLWVKKAFRDALNPPLVKSTDSEVLEFVKRTRGAVGYVSSVPRDNDVSSSGNFNPPDGMSQNLYLCSKSRRSSPRSYCSSRLS